MKNRILALALAVVMIFSLLPATARAAESGTWGGNITWTFENGLLTLAGQGEMADAEYIWDEEGSFAGTNTPWYSLAVTDVVIGEGITNVSYAAFTEMPTIKTVSLPSTVTVIGPWAFEYCTGLETINLPPYLTDIRYNAFYGCENLTGTLVIPEQVTRIEDDVFGYCANLEGVVLHDGITSIGLGAFCGTGITTVEIPASVTFIDYRAFAECPNLTAITVDPANPEYDSDDQGALYWEDYTELVQVPGGYTGDFHVPATVTQLFDDLVFYGCEGLENIYIPAGVTDMGSYLFTTCRSLEGIWVDDANETFYDIDGVLYGTVMAHNEDFEEVEYLALVTCPPAWDGASDFHVPAEVEQLSAYCFANCVNLENIYIPVGTESVYTGIFEGCSSLQGIWFAEGHKYFISDDEGVVFNNDTTEQVYDEATDAFLDVPVPAMTVLHFFPTGRTGYYAVPEGTTRVYGGAFSGAAIEAVKFPTSLERLDYWCMDGCDSLRWILFTGDKPSHGDGCFENVTATVYYPEVNGTWDEYDAEWDIHWGPDLYASYGDLTYVPYGPADMPVYPGQEPDPVVNPFTDVAEGSFYYDSVLWAVENGVTSGLTETAFGPTAVCNRAQVVTFLWRANGSPEPTTTEHSFVDVAEGAFYYKAMLWAVENGITNGTDATHFSPNAACNRATVVTFLWRALGNPEPESSENPFTDVNTGSWYGKAVLWAVENGITNGVDATHFGPTTDCNRATVVTFLYRACAE